MPKHIWYLAITRRTNGIANNGAFRRTHLHCCADTRGERRVAALDEDARVGVRLLHLRPSALPVALGAVRRLRRVRRSRPLHREDTAGFFVARKKTGFFF